MPTDKKEATVSRTIADAVADELDCLVQEFHIRFEKKGGT